MYVCNSIIFSFTSTSKNVCCNNITLNPVAEQISNTCFQRNEKGSLSKMSLTNSFADIYCCSGMLGSQAALPCYEKIFIPVWKVGGKNKERRKKIVYSETDMKSSSEKTAKYCRLGKLYIRKKNTPAARFCMNMGLWKFTKFVYNYDSIFVRWSIWSIWYTSWASKFIETTVCEDFTFFLNSPMYYIFCLKYESLLTSHCHF